MDNELDFKLNKNQQAKLNQLHEAAGKRFSWHLARVQGTGLKYWVIDLNNGYEWSGDVDSTIEGKTLNEVVDNALKQIRTMSTITIQPKKGCMPRSEPVTIVIVDENDRNWYGIRPRIGDVVYLYPKSTWEQVRSDAF